MPRNDAAVLAHIILEIEQILGTYLEPSTSPRDANFTIEQLLLNLDVNDAIGSAHRILDRARPEHR